MNYRTIADLNQSIARNLHRVPRDISVVAGVPRSGLLAANMLALHLNLPLTDLEGVASGRLLQGGYRQRTFVRRAERERYLVLDDSIHSGKSMAEARRFVAEKAPGADAVFAAVYATPKSADKVDLYFEICETPRIFEWNLLHHSHLRRSCVDIDGVLCRDPSEDENDDGPRYEAFLCDVAPYMVPTVEIGWLVTGRLEKYRKSTEAWLARHGVRFGQLVMMDYPDKASRKAAGNHAEFKAKVYRETDSVLFIESSRRQAETITLLSGKPVYCMDTREMLNPDAVTRLRAATAEKASRPFRWMRGLWGGPRISAHG
jgi:orotate phosphoribosyltransferase